MFYLDWDQRGESDALGDVGYSKCTTTGSELPVKLFPVVELLLQIIHASRTDGILVELHLGAQYLAGQAIELV